MKLNGTTERLSINRKEQQSKDCALGSSVLNSEGAEKEPQKGVHVSQANAF